MHCSLKEYSGNWRKRCPGLHGQNLHLGRSIPGATSRAAVSCIRRRGLICGMDREERSLPRFPMPSACLHPRFIGWRLAEGSQLHRSLGWWCCTASWLLGGASTLQGSFSSQNEPVCRATASYLAPERFHVMPVERLLLLHCCTVSTCFAHEAHMSHHSGQL